MGKRNEKKIAYQRYTSIAEMDSSDVELIQLARGVAQKAYAPYSHFHVGSAVLLANGEVVTGNNQENAAYPSGLCAERTALFTAHARFPDTAVDTLVVTATDQNDARPNFVRPCGGCLQVMAESTDRFKKPFRIIMDGAEGIDVVDSIDTLLPFRFKPSDLG